MPRDAKIPPHARAVVYSTTSSVRKATQRKNARGLQRAKKKNAAARGSSGTFPHYLTAVSYACDFSLEVLKGFATISCVRAPEKGFKDGGR